MWDYFVNCPDNRTQAPCLEGAIAGDLSAAFQIQWCTFANLISSELVKRLAVQTDPVPRPQKMRNSRGGRKIKLKEKVTLKFAIDEFPGIIFEEDFYVVQGRMDFFILGRSFLRNNDVTFGSDTGVIEIMGVKCTPHLMWCSIDAIMDRDGLLWLMLDALKYS